MSTATPRPELEPARRLSLSVVMPAYNEESNVEPAVRRMLDAIERVADPFEIIVVDDGSTDRTAEVAERLSDEDARVRIVRNERNVNYGVALQRGMREARYEWILHDGMDLPLAPEDIAGFLDRFAEADVIVMSRPSRTAHPPWRRLTSWTHNGLVRLLFRPESPDLNFVQFYRRDYVRSVRIRSTSPATVTPELILRAERGGRRVCRVEAEFRRRERGSGHFGRPKDIAWTLRDLLWLRVTTWLRGWDR